MAETRTSPSGHESFAESAQPNALWFCERCGSWAERDESNGLCMEDLPGWDDDE
jgi:hypothetical protein